MTILPSIQKVLLPGGLSSILILLLFSFFFISSLYLLWRVKRCIKKIHSYVYSSTFTSMGEDVYLRDYWFEYQRTFVEDGDTFVTEEEASLFFDGETMLSRLILIGYWVGVPSLLMGMGILGTFISLAFSLFYLQIETMDVILSGMESFFSILLMALSITIWGALLSLLFTLLERRLFHSFYMWVAKLSSRLNEVYRVSHWYLVKKAEKRQGEMLKDLLAPILSKEGVSSQINNNVKELFVETTRQNVELKQLSSELAQGVDLSSETMESLGQTLGKVFHRSLENSLQSFVVKLEEDLVTIMERVEHGIEKIQKTVIKPEDLERILPMIQDLLVTVSSEQRRELEGICQEIATSMKEMAVAIDVQSRDSRDQMERIKDSVSQVELLFKSMEDFVVSMEKSTQDLKDTSSILKQCTVSLHSEMESFLEEKRSTLLQLEKDLSLSGNLVKEYGENIAVIQGGLSSIFQEIDRGLKDYSSTVKTSLNSYLQDLSTNLEIAVTGLKSSMDDFRELLLEEETRRGNDFDR